jgi:hypothetical protein
MEGKNDTSVCSNKWKYCDTEYLQCSDFFYTFYNLSFLSGSSILSELIYSILGKRQNEFRTFGTLKKIKGTIYNESCSHQAPKIIG